MSARNGFKQATLAGAITLACAAAHAQTPLAESPWSTLRPIEPGRSDLGPLGIGTRIMPSDLRGPRDFEILYEGRGRDGQQWFARRDAGITAVFPRSVYVPFGPLDVPVIPPDTTFIIGDPTPEYAASLGIGPVPGAYPPPDASGGLRIDSRLAPPLMDQRLDTPAPGHHTRPEPPDTPRVGIAALLRRAAQGERQRN